MATVENPPTEPTGDLVTKKNGSWTQTAKGRALLSKSGPARAKKRAKTMKRRMRLALKLAKAEGKEWEALSGNDKLSFYMKVRQAEARGAGFSNVNGIKHHAVSASVPTFPLLIKKKYAKTVRREQLDEWQIKGAKQDLEHYRQEVKNIETFLRLAGVDVS